eukprot:TRINITY_DN4329_c0_g1_i4.p1 TRINITY_DN4329_c0_g1~~TRINITY_DN4329_c0_g1_i4.p1  ORF type:complete len:173 (+),score=32.92 TRINITY_DN4329_c0_g1_i4:245-763(+)
MNSSSYSTYSSYYSSYPSKCPACSCIHLSEGIEILSKAIPSANEFVDERGQYHDHDTVNERCKMWKCMKCAHIWAVSLPPRCWCGWSDRKATDDDVSNYVLGSTLSNNSSTSSSTSSSASSSAASSSTSASSTSSSSAPATTPATSGGESGTSSQTGADGEKTKSKNKCVVQ